MLSKRVLLAALSLGMIVAFSQSPVAAARVAEPVQAQLVSLSNLNLGDCCAPQPCPPQPVCCPKPCVTYRHHGPKLCCGCEPPVETTLKVKNPCTGCETDISVCLPACCKGEPAVCCGTGLFCRDVVEYEWCCGFRAKVAFKHNGDLIVSTWGR